MKGGIQQVFTSTLVERLLASTARDFIEKIR